VERRVGSHQHITAIPIDLGYDPRARNGRRTFEHMDGDSPAPNRIDNLRLSARPANSAPIARLAAAPGVEDRSIEDKTIITHLNHIRLCLADVCVLSCDLLDHV
jgi:hypothetical protein